MDAVGRGLTRTCAQWRRRLRAGIRCDRPGIHPGAMARAAVHWAVERVAIHSTWTLGSIETCSIDQDRPSACSVYPPARGGRATRRFGPGYRRPQTKFEGAAPHCTATTQHPQSPSIECQRRAAHFEARRRQPDGTHGPYHYDEPSRALQQRQVDESGPYTRARTSTAQTATTQHDTGKRGSLRSPAWLRTRSTHSHHHTDSWSARPDTTRRSVDASASTAERNHRTHDLLARSISNDSTLQPVLSPLGCSPPSSPLFSSSPRPSRLSPPRSPARPSATGTRRYATGRMATSPSSAPTTAMQTGRPWRTTRTRASLSSW